MKNYFITLSSLVLISCGAAQYVPVTPTQTDAERVQTSFASVTIEELNLGKSHYETQCGSCHKLKNPTRFSEAKWRDIVPKMTEKTNKKAKSVVVDAVKQEQILKYVVAMSNVTK